MRSPLRIGIGIPDPLAERRGGFFRNARRNPGRRSELPIRLLPRISSVGRCTLMPLADSFVCNLVPVRLSLHRDLPVLMVFVAGLDRDLRMPLFAFIRHVSPDRAHV